MSHLYVPTSAIAGGAYEERSEWSQEPPSDWETQLRSISPIVERTSHLRFRWFGAYGTWVLYECTPFALLDPFRIAQLTTHWTALPTKAERHVRRQEISDYQYYMAHKHQVEAGPFLLLHGPFGGTPAAWTDAEKGLLEAMELPTQVPALGDLPPCPFSETTLRQIAHRDRAIRAGGTLARLEKFNGAASLRVQMTEAEQAARKTFFAYYMQTIGGVAEYMLALRNQEQNPDLFSGGTKAEARAADVWREQYVETGEAPGLVTSAHSAPSSVRITVQ